MKRVSAETGGRQYYWPDVANDGVPKWQPGDTDPSWWEISSLGWCHGPLANRRDEPRIAGRVFITGARLVVVSDEFAHGAKFISLDGPSLVAAVATKVSQARADHASRGTFLVGQMRLPWVSEVVFGPATAAKSERGEIRLGSRYKTAFGDFEMVMLLFKLADHRYVSDFVEVLVERVRADRYEWHQTSDQIRAAWDALPRASSLVAPTGRLPSLKLPAAWRISDTSGALGVLSSQSLSASSKR